MYANKSMLDTRTHTQAFNFVEAPLADVDNQLLNFNSTALVNAVNALSYPDATQYPNCQYTTTFTWAEIAHPWGADTNGAGATTAWTGHPYAKQGAETPAAYMARVYDETDANCPTTNLFAAWQAAYDTVSRHK